MNTSYIFDSSDTTADVVLVSCDNVRFHTHKLILSLASSTFRDMFAIAQPPADGSIPAIPMAEDGQTVEKILRFCYPTKDPSFKDVPELYHVLVTMTRKYGMEDVALRIRTELRRFCDSGKDPLRVFAIAYAMGWKQEAAAAAQTAIQRPLLTPEDDDILELDILGSPRIIYRLLNFHKQRTGDAYKLAYIDGDEVDFVFKSNPFCEHHDICEHDGVGHFYYNAVPQKSWLFYYMSSVQEALLLKPTTASLYGRHEWAMQHARNIAAECSECAKCDLPALFDRYLPQTYVKRIEEALNKVSVYIVALRCLNELHFDRNSVCSACQGRKMKEIDQCTRTEVGTYT
ncbi:uncharacterized protein EV420DRAFT_1528489 [Desarmillaria tabescens]|uniref:BTB domain-containing protein n=1 Tax=Armillaria tabescens TaxID=1929756 RepID=A0AA39NAM8_ARMTA|nr:uncharacterized protein EV420DRAFT_1528489 [Desarmillaria tabescens]KAK0462049.1 hypothetical protein EV420DRAFT_1528489 [Desarmillaria tabescens]